MGDRRPEFTEEQRRWLLSTMGRIDRQAYHGLILHLQAEQRAALANARNQADPSLEVRARAFSDALVYVETCLAGAMAALDGETAPKSTPRSSHALQPALFGDAPLFTDEEAS